VPDDCAPGKGEAERNRQGRFQQKPCHRMAILRSRIDPGLTLCWAPRGPWLIGEGLDGGVVRRNQGRSSQPSGGQASSGEEKKDAGWVNWPKPCVLVALQRLMDGGNSGADYLRLTAGRDPPPPGGEGIRGRAALGWIALTSSRMRLQTMQTPWARARASASVRNFVRSLPSLRGAGPPP